MIIRLQRDDFDPERAAAECAVPGAGARVAFLGTVRDMTDDVAVREITVEHYPGMTERELARIAQKARAAHELLEVLVIHRFGVLAAGERIVLVCVWATHRKAAFAGCQEIVEALKTHAPFWKKEHGARGERWVEGGVPAAD